jgi:mono/diheme cytochrome c family protein
MRDPVTSSGTVTRGTRDLPLRRLAYGALTSAALAFLLFAPALPVQATSVAYHTLIIEWDGKQAMLTAGDLLAREDVETVTIEDPSAYPRQKMAYKALKMAALMKELGISGDRNMQFIALDGFTANIDAQLLLNTSEEGAIAYLAIEDPKDPWPPHRSGDGTAGPFYLFWLHPERSNIGREEWPYKFNRVVARDPVEKLYPEIVPAGSAPDHRVLEAGFRVFVKNCFTCHTLNGVGPGRMGPDLNYPMSPVEYFRDGVLRKYIRDPQSVRLHPRTAMGPFPPELISEEEMDQLLAYLRYMSTRKKKP